MKKQQIFLGIATLGGYFIKRHLDKKIAIERYNGYVDAVLCESIRFLAHSAINGYNKFLEAIEWLIDKPAFGEPIKSCNKQTLSWRASKCSHLRGVHLCPTLFKKEQFGLAKVSRMLNVAELDMYKISSKNNKWWNFKKSHFRREICALSKFVSNLYELEYLCYLAHSVLMNRQEQIKSLEFSGESFSKSCELCFELYLVSKSKYNLSEYDKSTHCQAELMVKYLWQIIVILSIKDLSTQTKDEIIAFIAQMQRIHALITEDFAENDKWRESKCVEAEQILKSFGESSKNLSSFAEFNSSESARRFGHSNAIV